ncbi:MAG: lipoyl(octanoyl) transferase LipB [Deltaproteobacteria bacterium]|nr:lipoyl(octanoyl) transferase LipB [Deltaproteobacteria bacterium]MDQ3299352.1 lipoyl(octanoyl) transferase LipB [Myxococcota bacterium]
MTEPWRVLDLGVASYRDVWAQQIALVEQRQAGHSPDTLVIVEHPHVFTLGRRREAAQNVLLAGDVEVIEIERGGDVTYHGPGQLVAYPILLLREGERDLHRFLRNLEEAVIATCVHAGIASASREPGKTGVWCDDATGARRKLCSMGIACRKWVTFHGLALNVTTDLAYFARINPCGFESRVMTTMEAELGTVDTAAIKQTLIAQLGTTLGRAAGSVDK